MSGVFLVIVSCELVCPVSWFEFSYHWYVYGGVPPVGVVVKVVCCPVVIVPPVGVVVAVIVGVGSGVSVNMAVKE